MDYFKWHGGRGKEGPSDENHSWFWSNLHLQLLTTGGVYPHPCPSDTHIMLGTTSEDDCGHLLRCLLRLSSSGDDDGPMLLLRGLSWRTEMLLTAQWQGFYTCLCSDVRKEQDVWKSNRGRWFDSYPTLSPPPPPKKISIASTPAACGQTRSKSHSTNMKWSLLCYRWLSYRSNSGGGIHFSIFFSLCQSQEIFAIKVSLILMLWQSISTLTQ